MTQKAGKHDFEAETCTLSLRNDLNLIYTFSNLIRTLTKIDSKDSQEIAVISADAIHRAAAELTDHVHGLYEARDADKAAEKDQHEAEQNEA